MAASGVLPTFQRYVNGVPVPPARKTLRLKEKYVILLVFGTFGIVCFGAFFFLPNLQEKVNIVEVKKHLKDAGDMAGNMFNIHEKEGGNGKVIGIRHDDLVDPHKIDDKIRLQMNIEKEWANAKVQEALDKQGIKADEAQKLKDSIQSDKDKVIQMQIEEDTKKKEEERQNALKVEKEHSGHPGAQGGEPSDAAARDRRNTVKAVSIDHNDRLITKLCFNYHNFARHSKDLHALFVSMKRTFVTVPQTHFFFFFFFIDIVAIPIVG